MTLFGIPVVVKNIEPLPEIKFGNLDWYKDHLLDGTKIKGMLWDENGVKYCELELPDGTTKTFYRE